MANARRDSTVISSGLLNDETNSNNQSKKFPSNLNERSSTSSIDSNSGKNIHLIGDKNGLNQPSSPNVPATPSTTTDSDFESEQDENFQPEEEQRKNQLTNPKQLNRRVRHFCKLFKSEIPNHIPNVIYSYVCAYQGDILLQGKMYITDHYLCFHSRIINYVTKHVYRWEQIERIRKERIAYIFPTAISIQLKPSGKKVIYASFLQRDQAYEKIYSIWSKHTNEIFSCGDDDDNDIAQDGTLKANNQPDKLKYSNHDAYDGNDDNEQDVLRICLKDNGKRSSPTDRKTSDEKLSTKKLINSYEKKQSGKTSNSEEKSSINRPSRYAKTEQKSNEIKKRSNSLGNHRAQSTSRQNLNNERTEDITPESNSSSMPIPNENPPETNQNSSGIFNKTLAIIYQIRPFVTSIFPSYPFKTMIIIFLILTILFFHSFYLVKLAYRIENRLQSLHHSWPSSFSMKNSFSSNVKNL